MPFYELLSIVRSSLHWRLVRPWCSWWIWAPLSIGMGIVFSTGPIIQEYIVSLINSDEASIYGSSFQQNIVKLPSFSEWLSNAFSWPNPMIGLIVVLLSVRSPSFKNVFLRFALFSCLTLTAFDVSYSLIRGDLSAQLLFTNVISNIFGGVIAAGVASITVLTANYGFREFELPDAWRRLIGGALGLTTSLSVFLITYYVVDFLYRPRPVDIAIGTQGNASGYIIAEEAPKGSRTSKSGNTGPAFVPLSEAQEIGGVNWRAASNARIEKTTTRDGETFDVKVSLYRGCVPNSGAHSLLSDETSLSFKGVRSLSLRHEWGLWDTTVVSENSSGSVTATGIDGASFIKKADMDGKKIEIQQFVDEGTKVRYSSGFHELDVFAIAPPGRTDLQMPADPKIYLEVDQRIYPVEVHSLGDPNSSHIPRCEPLETAMAFEKGYVSLGNEVLLGVRVRISKALDFHDPDAPDNFVELKGDHGWVTAFDIAPASLTSTIGKRVDLISLMEGVASFSINGTERTVNAADSYVAVGDKLEGSFHSGSLNVQGRAAILWVNSSRANPTKWETIPIEYRIAVITFAAAFLVYLFRILAGKLNDNAQLDWLEDGRSGV